MVTLAVKLKFNENGPTSVPPGPEMVYEPGLRNGWPEIYAAKPPPAPRRPRYGDVGVLEVA